MQTVVGLIVLVAMIIAGLILARARRRQLLELTGKLKSLEESL
jgi:flagellar motor component MotA